MSLLKKWIRRTRAHIELLSGRAKLAAVALTLLALGGGIWLAVTASRGDMVPLSAGALTADKLPAADAILSQRGIRHRLEGGKLLVSPAAVQEAQTLLADGGVLPRDEGGAFEQFFRENDLWSSQAQTDRRWLVAKMNKLGELISAFPAVQSATVLIDSGSPRRVGHAGESASAAVRVQLKGDARMTDKLAAAIADLVAGSVAGMTRQNVRIIDGQGTSFRPWESASPATAAADGLRAAEGYYLDKIHACLAYIDNACVTVTAGIDGATARCTGATISVPRSYLATVAAASRGLGASAVTDDDIQVVAASHLPKLQQTVAQAVGLADPAAVKADWYYDAASVPAAAPQLAPLASPWWASRDAWAACAISAVAGALMLAGAVLAGRRRKRRRAAMSANASSGEAGEHPADSSAADSRESAPFFGFLADVSAADLLEALKDEHPQTVAVVLAHMDKHEAAVVLAAMPASRQVEIARRIASLDRVDPDVAADVERTLAARLAGMPSSSNRACGGPSAVAEILQHAAFATQHAILEGLTPAEPLLAETIRQRLFVFEDIAEMPAQRLGPALAGLADDELAVALRTAGDEVKSKILSALPATAARRVRAEMERIGPVRLSDVEAAQQKVVATVRRHEDGAYAPENKPSGVLA